MTPLGIFIWFAGGAFTGCLFTAIMCRWVAGRDANTARVQIEFSRERTDDIQRRLSAAEAGIVLRDARERGLQQEITRHKAEEATFQARVAELNRAHSSLRDAFQALSVDALRNNAESFIQLARGEFDRLQEGSRSEMATRQASIDAVLAPIRDGLAKYDEKLFEIERERTRSYAGLEEQMRHVSATSEGLRAETASLAGALRSSNVRGMWGEVQLRRCCELAGMLDHCDFRTQQSVDGDEGRRRPDLVVQLPGRKTIVVDSKVPLTGVPRGGAM